MRNSLTCESYSKLLCSSTRSTHARACSQEIRRRHSSAQSHERAPLNTSLPWATVLHKLPPVLHSAPHLCCAPDHQGTGFTKQGTEIQPQRRWQIGKPSWDVFVGASSAIKGVKPSPLPANAHCPLHHTGDRGVPAAAANHKGREFCRGKAKAKIHTQVALQELILLLVSSVTVWKSIIIINVINSDLGRL